MTNVNSGWWRLFAALTLAVAQVRGQLVTVSVGAANSTVSIAANVPAALVSKVRAMGDRFQIAGKERVTLTGTFTGVSAAAKGVTLIYETPRKFAYLEGAVKSVSFDGLQASITASQDAAEILESFLEDSMDGIVFVAPQAQRFRPLMYRARLDDGKARVYSGPYADIYEIVAPAPALGGLVRQKHYYFDSTTQLLSKVNYLKGTPQQPVRVETVFSNWRVVNNTQVAGTITRNENGAQRLVFSAAQIVVSGAVNDNAFKLP